MDFSSTGKLPRLLPLWQDLAALNIMNPRTEDKYTKDKLPDYGGMGVDLPFTENEFKSDIRKHNVDKVHFGSQACALPFIPANKIPLIEDPCMSLLNALKSDFEKFSLSMCMARRSLNLNSHKATKEQRKEEILTLQKSVKQVSLNESNEKIPVPNKIIEMAKKLPFSNNIPEINFNYTGGCLISSQLGNKTYLLHPTGKKLDELALTLLEETSDPHKTFSPKVKDKTIKLKSGCILQVKSAFDGYCYVLQKKRCHFVNLADISNIYSNKCLLDQSVTSIIASPYHPHELISINEDGKVILNDVEAKQKIWETDKFAVDEEYCVDGPLACEFGSHPRSVLYLASKVFYAHDLRSDGNKKTLLLSNKHSTMFKNETFHFVKRLAINPFQHLVSSSHHFCLCDERYPKKPVLIWNHMLNGSSLYCDIATYDNRPQFSDSVVLCGTQDTNELVSFVVRTHDSHIQTVSLSSPLLLSSLTDCVDSLKLHCMDVDEDTVKRLSYSLAGVCAVPHRNKLGFTALQINSVGDIFYQDFGHISDCNAERTHKVGTGCVLTTPEIIMPALNSWTTSLKTPTRESPRNQLEKLYVDLTEIVNMERKISNQCHICKHWTSDKSTKVIESNACSFCGLDEHESERLQEDYNNLSLLVGPVEEDLDHLLLDTKELHLFKDKYSRKILEPWISLGDESRTPPWSNNSEFELSNFSTETSMSCSNFPNTDRDMDNSLQDVCPEINFQSYGAESFQDISMYSQESTENFVLPSQEIRPKIGETLKTSAKKIKLDYHKLNKSRAGF